MSDPPAANPYTTPEVTVSAGGNDRPDGWTEESWKLANSCRSWLSVVSACCGLIGGVVTLAASAMVFTLSNVPVVRVPMLVYLAGLIYVGVCAIGVSIGAYRMRGALQQRSTFTDLLPPLRFAAISAGLLTLGLIVLPFAIGFAGAAAAW